MQFEIYAKKWEDFKSELRNRLSTESAHTGWRFYEEMYDHKRVREISAWCGEGEQELGHVFLAKPHGSTPWDGTVDWTRVMAIVEDDSLALTFDQPSRVWDLGALATQVEPRDRCANCGKLE